MATEQKVAVITGGVTGHWRRAGSWVSRSRLSCCRQLPVHQA